MIFTGKNYMMAIEDAAGVSEGIKFIAVALLVIFLVECLLVLAGRKERKIPVKSYTAYMVAYFLYRLTVV